VSLAFYNHPIALRGLKIFALGRGFLRLRNPNRRAAWKHRVAFYDRAWRQAADELGASFRTLGSGFHEITLDGSRTFVNDNSSAIDNRVTLDLMSDKPLTYRLLLAESLPIPEHCVFNLKNIRPAVEFLEATKACVVKPARGTGGGRGITTGIQSRWQLARAAANAAAYCDDVVIERHVEGRNYRLLYLDGELIDAFVREPPSVTGDGRSTVKKLVHHANSQRLREEARLSQVQLTIDLDMKRTLGRHGLSLRSVPAEGQAVILKTVVNENCGADNTTATQTLCPSIIRDGTVAVKTTGVRLGGVDVITTDPTRPLAATGGVILEVNAPPNFYYHYNKRDGAIPVALHVLRRILLGKQDFLQSEKPVEASFV
jgi:D-alanine-D-alanine ligase-like ATP-grasp enzyme